MIAQAIVIVPGMVLFSEYCAALNDLIVMVLAALTEHIWLSSVVAPEPVPIPPTKRASLIKRLSAIGFPIQYRYGSLVEIGGTQGKFTEHPVERCCRDPNSEISRRDSVHDGDDKGHASGAVDPGIRV